MVAGFNSERVKFIMEPNDSIINLVQGEGDTHNLTSNVRMKARVDEVLIPRVTIGGK